MRTIETGMLQRGEGEWLFYYGVNTAPRMISLANSYNLFGAASKLGEEGWEIKIQTESAEKPAWIFQRPVG